MNAKEVRSLLEQVRVPDYEFVILEDDAGKMFLQASYVEPDIVTQMPTVQRTRKWFISGHAVPSEIVQTALKCILTSAEHRVREHFFYKGERIYGPHFDVEALHEIAKARRLDYRDKKPKNAVRPD